MRQVFISYSSKDYPQALAVRNVLEQNGIRVVRGCHGAVEELVLDYLAGKVEDNGEGCHSHECH